MNNKFKFTIIITAQKDEYIEDTISSITKQDIGFNNVQLIILYDPLQEKILGTINKYKVLYPKNIFVIEKNKDSIWKSRNIGINYLKGKYVNFMDDGSKIKKDALRKVYSFFEKNFDQTDIISIPIKYFQEINEEHILNYKFKKGTRIIDLKEEWDSPQIQISSCYIKNTIFNLGYRFDEDNGEADDIKFIQSILSEKQTLGVITDTVYYCRRLEKRTQTLNSSIRNAKDAIQYIDHQYNELICFYLTKFKYVPKSVQNTICIDFQSKILNNKLLKSQSNYSEKKEILHLSKQLFSKIDFEIIKNQRFIDIGTKVVLYELKEEKINKKEINNIPSLVINTEIIYSEEKDAIVKMDFIKTEGERLLINGRYLSIFKEQPQIVLINNKNIYKAEVEKLQGEDCLIKNNVLNKYRFKISLNIESEAEYKLQIENNNLYYSPKNIEYGQYFPLSNKFTHMYCHINKYLLIKKDNSFCFYKYRRAKHLLFEINYLFDLMCYNKHERLCIVTKKAIIVRTIVNIGKIFKKRKTWLFRDRVISADDNGIALYNYAKTKEKKAKLYFVLSKESKEYKQIKKDGNVIDALSWKSKIIYLLSDFVFSSSGDHDAVKPFYDYNEPYKDIEHNIKKIFLTHGVAINDLSGWLSKYEMNFTGFLCSAEKEKESLLGEKYGYTSDEIWLTGMPRYDNLNNNKEKLIVVAPTWREYLISGKEKNDHRYLNPGFTNSQYYINYNSLLNNKKLIKYLEKNEYKLAYYSHPTLKEYSYYFENKIHIIEPNMKYSEVFSKASLLITDYSSASFDFAFLKKPVIYFQFDEEEFFEKHKIYERGYFSYLKDGFGEIEYNVNDLVDRIIEYINNECKMKEKYIRRVNNFFEYNDKNNCERVLKKVYEIESH